MRIRSGVCLGLLGAVLATAQIPAITAVENAASYIVPGLPNSGIAQGSMFVVKGSRLGPAAAVVASTFPLQTNLAGTSVKITIAGETVDAILYYTLEKQVAAILPSRTPVGAGIVTVSYNGGTAAGPIVVVPSNPGLYTQSQTGNGDAVATPGDYSLVLPDNSANFGEVVVLWANGLGPVTDDETRAAAGGDMPGVPLQVFIGGKAADVLYRGRNACCVSVDQINVRVPAGVTGCSVAIILQVGEFVSSSANIPVAVSGKLCPPTRPAITQGDLQRLLAKKNALSSGAIVLRRVVTKAETFRVTGSDSGVASFPQTTAAQNLLVDSTVDIMSFGSCSIVTYLNQNTYNPLGASSTRALDIGPSIAVSGPNGSRSLSKQSTGSGYSAAFDSTATFLDAGSYTLSGTGGTDAGSFRVQLSVPAFSWTNRDDILYVNRAGGLAVNWTGGDPAGYVAIGGLSAVVVGSNLAAAYFTCTAKATDRTFRVPPVVLRALPPSSQGFNGLSIVQVTSYSEATFEAAGLDLGIAQSAITYASSAVNFQ